MYRQALAIIPLLISSAAAQSWDPGSWIVNKVNQTTDEKLKFTFETRLRYESRTGNAFGKDVDVETGLERTCFGLSYNVTSWFKVSATAQDSHAPWYGANAPNSVRDELDLNEAYVGLFPSSKAGFGLRAGRMQLNYGDGRLIGKPNWSNVSRPYDHTAVQWRTKAAQFELLFLSPVKVRVGEFNRPVLGDRMWGTYDVFPNLFHKSLAEAYFLRRDQNRQGGFTGGTASAGTDKQDTNTVGIRSTGPLALNWNYTVEGILQNGKVGPANLNAGAWYSQLNRRWKIAGKLLDVSAEYKYASGTDNPSDTAHSGTFDQLYASNHNNFGKQDLFSWRNLRTVRGLISYGLTKNLSVTVAYFDFWLASARDGLYSFSGKQVARSVDGSAGTHVGREADLFGTYKYGHFSFGAGYGHFFTGQFVDKTTPGVGPAYMYIFHTYTL